MPTNPFDANAVEQALAGRYKILNELRVGGQGAVFQAIQNTTHTNQSARRAVALKLHFDPKQDIRVEREINAMRGLTHPCLAQLIEHGTCTLNAQTTRYIAWEYIPGGALDTRLTKGPLTEHDVLRIGHDVSAAITAIWAKRIVHRDVNPKNIMLRQTGGAVLIDLGGARHLDETSVTAPGSTFGTIGYFSPEQYRAERALTSASDVFSLGIVLQQCLTGQHPTHFDQHRLATAPPACAQIAPTTSPPLANIIDRMLAIRAAFRPTPEELTTLFQGLRGH